MGTSLNNWYLDRIRFKMITEGIVHENFIRDRTMPVYPVFLKCDSEYRLTQYPELRSTPASEACGDAVIASR